MGKILGIDLVLQTQYNVARWRASNIVNTRGIAHQLVVGFRGGDRIVGKAARTQAVTNPCKLCYPSAFHKAQS